MKVVVRLRRENGPATISSTKSEGFGVGRSDVPSAGSWRRKQLGDCAGGVRIQQANHYSRELQQDVELVFTNERNMASNTPY